MHITTLFSKLTHIYEPGEQAKEASMTIAAQQHNANQPIKLPAAAKWHVFAAPAHPKVLTQGRRSPVVGNNG